MPHSQPEDAPGRAEAPDSHGPEAAQDVPTLYEFLTRIVTSPDAREAFAADPQAMLNQAGLGDMSATDVLQATSLVLDYAPVEVAETYGRTLQTSAETFAANSQHVAIKELHPALPHEQEVTELSMLPSHNTPAPSPNEDPSTNINVEQNDSHNLINVHDVLSGNDIANGAGDTVGDVTGGVGNTVGNVTNSVDNTVNTVGDVTGNVGNVTGDLGGVTNTVGDVAGGVGDL